MTRGRREGRVSADTHGPRATKKHAAEPQDQPDTGLPCAMVLRLIRDLPGDRLSCPRVATTLNALRWHQHRDVRTTRLRRPFRRQPSAVAFTSIAARTRVS